MKAVSTPVFPQSAKTTSGNSYHLASITLIPLTVHYTMLSHTTLLSQLPVIYYRWFMVSITSADKNRTRNAVVVPPNDEYQCVQHTHTHTTWRWSLLLLLAGGEFVSLCSFRDEVVSYGLVVVVVGGKERRC